MSSTRPPLAKSGTWQLLALMIVTFALMISAGGRNLEALLLLGLATVVMVAAREAEPGEPPPTAWVLAAVAGVIAFAFNLDILGASEGIGLGIVAVGVVLALLDRERIRMAGLAIAATGNIVACVLPWQWGRGLFDVYSLEAVGAQALLHGQNPYAPSIWDRMAVAPGVVAYGHEHLPYGVLAAAGGVPGALFGEIRLATLLWAVAATAATVVLCRRGRLTSISRRHLALLAVASPLLPSMVVTAWPETLLVAGFGLWLVAQEKHPRWAVLALTAALLVKPTALVLAFPFFVWSTRWRRQIIASSVIAGVVMLVASIGVGIPLVLDSTVLRHIFEPPRQDGLSLVAFLTMPSWGFALSVILACIVALWRRPRDVGDLCNAAALLFLVSTATAKYARFNFYYVSAAVLLMALAAYRQPTGELSLPIPRLPLRRASRARTNPSSPDPAGA